ncbi:hypothetical protein TPENAI_60585 [Tenacibaculum litopenaei]|uniref:hypothetical protein n=1 Tax=Tenacibaculum litopenaei TaxID=396016 RepID=UPI0038941A6D
MKETSTENIHRYLFSEMSPSEMSTFEAHCKRQPDLWLELLDTYEFHRSFNNPNLGSHTHILELEAQKNIRKLLHSAELQKSSKSIKKTAQRYHQRKKRKQLKLWGFTTVAAATIALLITLTVLPNKYEAIYNQHSDWHDLPSFIEKGTTQNQLISIEKRYQNHLYQQVIDLSRQNTSVYSLMYEGAAEVQLKNYPAALLCFKRLAAMEHLESSRGYWYQLLVYITTEDRENTQRMLRKILSSSDHYNYHKAIAIQQQLH